MGRTFEIRSDDQYLEHVDLQKLQALVSSLKHTRMITRSYAEYEDIENSFYMTIDLVFYDESRNMLDLDHPELLSLENANQVNAIQLNIPIGSLHGDERDQCYIDLALAIARHLRWRLYDCDCGTYLDLSPS